MPIRHSEKKMGKGLASKNELIFVFNSGYITNISKNTLCQQPFQIKLLDLTWV